MQEFIKNINIICRHNIDILLEGATGTGKDYWAHYIHQHSTVKGKFIAINCAAIPETLAESELFGCEAGAYTGARKRIGKIELANNGTLYLDEIDSMPINLQAKLLRVLQDKGCERVGSSTFIPSNFRLIASTKVNLIDLIEKNKFREDLYYRINTIKIDIPLLKHRKEDIIDLFYTYTEQAQLKFGIEDKANHLIKDKKLVDKLLSYEWQGNIRELIAITQRYTLDLPLYI
jgi:transcriptional regulator with PAS, ATPase and Fis domain